MFAITQSSLNAGVWEGQIETDDDTAPEIEIFLGDRVLGGLEVQQSGDRRWAARLPIPSDCIADGVRTFVVRTRGGGLPLWHFSLIAGQPAESELRAEIAQLRAELDILKQAVRRHLAAGRG
ncbi:hypothetical protein OEW28_04355 [Defluviimonas sp. WL0002]|uniref:Uncharacterized protein n=1 Tax=Albidovulum marisflavi TaxID=2984159 RepID=A0ABT2Z9S2_9RHOB|nr:hypothetical protein [Defluviimonas sp. WL0002]MCV2867851.1 hypothetical protein [Defluviimonas sp. WL0002]